MRLRKVGIDLVSALFPLALIALAVALGTVGDPSLTASVTLILCNLIIVCGLQVFVGNSGVYSFGQIGFAAAGAYAAALVTLPPALAALQTPAFPDFLRAGDLSPTVVTLIALLGCGLLALAVGPLLLRTSSLAIPISTFAFLLVSYTVIANWGRLTGGSAGLVDIPTTTTVQSAGLWAGFAALVALAFKWSAGGYRLQAAREDEVAARSLGIRVLRVRLAAFAISAMLCAAGGALAARESGVLTPTSFYFGATVTTLTMLVVGGTRSVFGAVAGGLAVAGLNEALRSLEEGASLFGLVSIGETPGLAAIGLGLLLLGAMIAMPEGLSGGREAGEWLLRSPRQAPTAVNPVQFRPSPPDARRVECSLCASGVSVSFGGLKVLDGIDLELIRGEVLGLIGPNGAGKTTLVNVLSGFQRPQSGKVLLDEIDVTGWAPERLARTGLARSFQAALPFRRLTSLEAVAVGAMGVGLSKRPATARATALLERLGLAAAASSPMGSLPPGTQRLLGVARALATQPRYLLLDEPAAGLNEAERRDLISRLRPLPQELDCGILVIEHDMALVADLCPEAQVIDDGSTVAIGAPTDLREDPAVIESYLGTGFLVGANA